MIGPVEAGVLVGLFLLVSSGKTLFEYDEKTGTYVEWYVLDLVWRDDGVSAILTRGNRRATVNADDLADTVTNEDDPSWVPAMYDGTDDDGGVEWIPHPRLADAPDDQTDPDVNLRVAPETPSDLTFEKIEGCGSRTEVNNFLKDVGDSEIAEMVPP